MVKRYLSVLLFFMTALFAFEPVAYETIVDMAKKVNKKLDSKTIEEFRLKNERKNKNVKPVHIEKDRTEKTLEIKPKNKKPVLIIKRNEKRESVKLIRLPYLRFEDVVKKIIGSPNDMGNSLCKIKIGEKEKIDSCWHIKEWIDERNRLLDEFVKDLYKLKTDIKKHNIYYRGKFSCGILYKYYTYEHYNDCYKMFNYMTPEEKETIYSYVKSFLSF